MPAHTFAALDYVVLVSLLALSAAIGVLFAWRDRRKNNNRQFLTANRELSWVPVSMSMMASFLSSTSVLGLPSEVFVRGSTMWTGAIGTTLAILMAAFIFMPMYYKMDITSINEVHDIPRCCVIRSFTGSWIWTLEAFNEMAIVSTFSAETMSLIIFSTKDRDEWLALFRHLHSKWVKREMNWYRNVLL
ncbi:hypothetical protein HPB51_024558 [Rhipicephalus microplus]|uniref:Sodium/solute symporter n=1 Tax=Rhipicephalus microplus TaxID=6941 RepID=A0A9J6DKD3_RHIMP|nr:hypothetical protein HPB51_024558 [Rhipicephalus microplus]